MPCSDGGPSPYDRLSEEVKKHKSETRLMASMLCSACLALESTGYDFKQNPRLDEWWDAHKKVDEHRELRERLHRERLDSIKKKHFDELTDDDKRFLKDNGYL